MTKIFDELASICIKNNIIEKQNIEELINEYNEIDAIVKIISLDEFILNYEKVESAWKLLEKTYLKSPDFIIKFIEKKVYLDVKHDFIALILKRHVDKQILNEPKFIRQVLNFCSFFNLFDFDINNEDHYNIVLDELNDHRYLFKRLSYEFRNNKKFVMDAIEKNPEILVDIFDKFKDDSQVMELAVKRLPNNFKYASDRLKNDLDFASKAIKRKGDNLKYTPTQLRDKKDFVLQAIQKDPYSIRYASDRLKNDKELALLAISKRPGCLQFLSDELKDDKEVVLLAVSLSSSELMNSSDRLRADKEIVKKSMRDICFLQHSEYVSKEIKNDDDVFKWISDAYKEEHKRIEDDYKRR
ncbi:DUF4116 domain-containing protein [Mycoplasmopsis mucosicanis]|uniref:DUF4116 domain-containing protein n=1 Tax=Mycoplasmopsis mucosicanis TaxID=458208 RepID=A0A507SJ67_9BACT|nr:DUF4116 domain-containing protein [Mycoplasmopsis mucosicanis]TQC51261.1 DUF4116 domain-containing protein [Mycoplasmopsis mucosicanis]